ncbi:hypothetical protein C7212DRAFT_364617 [Tuber magnatum]|uniref:Uncharacterized protein n=1 Tax=Tuber magnatum TaxID=42249 RepID=A0A317SMJ4_9PEZI|nr:hypothetical protein C7212DRAFT_364617 [Tuber magnatum]
MSPQTPTPTNDREVYILPISPPGSGQVIVLPPTWVTPPNRVAPPIPEDVVIVDAVHPDEEKEIVLVPIAVSLRAFATWVRILFHSLSPYHRIPWARGGWTADNARVRGSRRSIMDCTLLRDRELLGRRWKLNDSFDHNNYRITSKRIPQS